MEKHQNTIVKSVVVKKRTNIAEKQPAVTANQKPQSRNNKPHKPKSINKSSVKHGHKSKTVAEKRPENKIYTDEMLQAMTRDDLNKLALAQSDEVARITNQIDQAKALSKSTGVRIDAKWLGQAACAKRMKNNLLSRIYMTINMKKKEMNLRKGEAFERTFMHMAKNILSDDEYANIMNATRVEVALKGA